MIILVFGVALWSAAHLFKRVAPDARARLGDRGRGIVAVALFASIVLMVIGYKSADGPVWWGRTPALTGINNLLLLAAFYLFAASGMKTRVTRLTRHPQLIAFSLWAIGHLLVNGDLPSFILFGGLLIWALAEMAIINAQDGPHTPPHPVPVRKEAMAVVAALVVFSVVAGIHWLLGYPPFG